MGAGTLNLLLLVVPFSLVSGELSLRVQVHCQPEPEWQLQLELEVRSQRILELEPASEPQASCREPATCRNWKGNVNLLKGLLLVVAQHWHFMNSLAGLNEVQACQRA